MKFSSPAAKSALLLLAFAILWIGAISAGAVFLLGTPLWVGGAVAAALAAITAAGTRTMLKEAKLAPPDPEDQTPGSGIPIGVFGARRQRQPNRRLRPASGHAASRQGNEISESPQS